jgi:hypothetical protein
MSWTGFDLTFPWMGIPGIITKDLELEFKILDIEEFEDKYSIVIEEGHCFGEFAYCSYNNVCEDFVLICKQSNKKNIYDILKYNLHGKPFPLKKGMLLKHDGGWIPGQKSRYPKSKLNIDRSLYNKYAKVTDNDLFRRIKSGEDVYGQFY